MQVDNEFYEMRLKATMNGLNLDLDRLYRLSFQRFAKPITYNTPRSRSGGGSGGGSAGNSAGGAIHNPRSRSSSSSSSPTRLEICLDNEVDVVTGLGKNILFIRKCVSN